MASFRISGIYLMRLCVCECGFAQSAPYVFFWSLSGQVVVGGAATVLALIRELSV